MERKEQSSVFGTVTAGGMVGWDVGGGANKGGKG